MYRYNQLVAYNYPLNVRSVIGTLGFQFLLSGTSEEILFRALPITILVSTFERSINIKWHITLETFIAAFLFSIAHIHWSLSPLTIEMDSFQLFYALVLGISYGVVYQRTNSILYPMIMHSTSNVLMVGIGYIFTMF